MVRSPCSWWMICNTEHDLGQIFSTVVYHMCKGWTLTRKFVPVIFCENNSWRLTYISFARVYTCLSCSIWRGCRELFLPNTHAENCFCLIHIWRLLSCLITFPFYRNESIHVLQLFPMACFQRPLVIFYSLPLDFCFAWVWFPDLD